MVAAYEVQQVGKSRVQNQVCFHAQETEERVPKVALDIPGSVLRAGTRIFTGPFIVEPKDRKCLRGSSDYQGFRLDEMLWKRYSSPH